MQFSSLIMALAASKAVSAQAYAAANANVNVDVSAVAEAGAAAPPAPAYPPPAAPTYAAPAGSNYSNPYPYPPGCTTTSTHPATLTVTDLTVSTYCPVCDEAKINGDVYTTTYETIYASVCPTGLTSATYTVTQTCTGTTPIDYATPAPGFQAVTTVCDVCPGSPTLTITQPCDVCDSKPTAAVTYAPSSAGGASPVNSIVPFTGAAASISMSALSAFAGVVSVFFGMLLL